MGDTTDGGFTTEKLGGFVQIGHQIPHFQGLQSVNKYKILILGAWGCMFLNNNETYIICENTTFPSKCTEVVWTHAA